MMEEHANDRVSMRWWIGEDCLMLASNDGAEENMMMAQEEEAVGVSVHD